MPGWGAVYSLYLAWCLPNQLECLLQVKALKAGHCPMCPYCKADFSIYFHGPATAEQRLKFETEDNEQALAWEKSRKVQSVLWCCCTRCSWLHCDRKSFLFLLSAFCLQGEQQESPKAETQQLFEVRPPSVAHPTCNNTPLFQLAPQYST